MASFNKNNSLMLSWDQQLRNSDHKSNVTEREIFMATNKFLAHEDVMRSSYMFDNLDARLKRKWKEIRHIHMILSQPKYKFGNIENALWFFGHKAMDVLQFVAAIVNEFEFEFSLHMDKHLKFLYWACEGGVKDQVDSREIVASFKILAYYKLIKYKPIELLICMFDIYAFGNSKPGDNPNDTWYIKNPPEVLHKIFSIPCEDAGELSVVSEYITEFFGLFVKSMESSGKVPNAEAEFMNHFTRAKYKQFLKTCPKLIAFYSKLCWARIPTDLRLESLDFEQLNSLTAMDDYLQKYLLSQALRMYKKNLKLFQFRTWKIMMTLGRKVRQHEIRKFVRLRKSYFRHWRIDARKSVTKRKRRLLAEVIGNFSLMARCFARFRLYNYNMRKITAVCGSYNPNATRYKQAVFYVREFNRKRELRDSFIRWWNEIRYMIDYEIAASHDWVRVTRRVFIPWRKDAHYEQMNKRLEILAYENKNKFDKMMENVVVDVQELMSLEKERDDRIEAAKNQKKAEDKAKQLENSKKRLVQLKEADKALILKMQAEARRKRLKKAMKKIKDNFDVKWEKIKNEMVSKAKSNMKDYIEHKDNIQAMQFKLEKLKKEFFQPPAPEFQERERILTSPKNLVFTYLDFKLKNEKLDLSKVIKKFDKSGRGDLTHDEFTVCIKSLKIPQLNAALIGEVIKGVDADNDGFISLEELQSSMKDIESEYMGVKGSPWRMYVDVSNDVICYHNFLTTEKIFEYSMTDEKLNEILRINMICESEYNALALWKKDKEAAWKVLIEDRMARRMQYLYRQFKARRVRQDKLWIVKAQISGSIRFAQEKVVFWIESFLKGIQVRKIFAKQLKLTYEKCWDIDSGRLFYLNHLTKTSVWERPKLLWRYGDVMMPCPWVPFEAPANKDVTVAQSAMQMFKIHYWHVKAKREIPKKPDGFPLCSYCQRNISLCRCLDCQAEFCGKCIYETHGSQTEFRQNDKVELDQMKNKRFVERLNKFLQHKQVPSQPFKCQSCKTDKMNAGIYCRDCGLNLCRPCSRRIHEQKAQSKHELWEI